MAEQTKNKSALSDALIKKQDNSIKREPTKSELAYFLKNKNVSGMATKDNKVILNPYSKLKDNEKKAVVKNEMSRIFMRKLPKSSFQLTDKQKKKFKHYGSEQNVRDTIIGRIISGDPSALDVTEEQKAYADNIKKKMSEQ